MKCRFSFCSSLQLCHIDCQAEGGIPSYSFALMVIFFLQQRKQPILPVYLGRWVSDSGLKLVTVTHSHVGDVSTGGQLNGEEENQSIQGGQLLVLNGWGE